MNAEGRRKLIIELEKLDKSDIIAYFLADRMGTPQANIGEDAVSFLFEHLNALRETSDKRRLSLFLYSRGGAVEVPWRIVSMIRELYRELAVIISYKAHSAATMVALGADEIVMGPKGEMGPIDPSLGIREDAKGTVIKQQINVEDVMSYLSFLKEKAGLSDQEALSSSVGILAKKLDPWLIGNMYRTKEHINLVARKLLTSGGKKLDEGKLSSIIEALVEKTYYHGHAIGRREAKELGLPVVIPKPNSDIEKIIWKLYKAYEDFFKLKEPLDAEFLVEDSQSDYSEDSLPIACIESRLKYHEFNGRLEFKRIRKQPPQLNINLNLNLQLPSGLQPGQINQNLINQLLRSLQSQLMDEVRQQVESQLPIIGVKAAFRDARWREIKPYPRKRQAPSQPRRRRGRRQSR